MPIWLAGLIFNRYTAMLAGAAALVFSAWWWHTSRVDSAVDAAKAEMAAQIEAERTANRAKVSEWVVAMVEREAVANARYAKAVQERREVFVTLEKEVTRYVTLLADSRCVVPVGFVWHHDAAAAARAAADPGAAGGLVDTDSGIALSSVETTVSANYAICHDAIAEVKRWREWYVELQAQWEKLRANLKGTS